MIEMVEGMIETVEGYGPTEISRYPNDDVEYQGWRIWVTDSITGMSSHRFHRTNGPARIWYHKNGLVFQEYWMMDDISHRIDGPASVIYDKAGTIRKKEWAVDGQRHKTDGPAIISYDSNGVIIKECWVVRGNIHKTDGPATISYDEDRNVIDEVWWMNDKELFIDEWLIENDLSYPYSDEDRMAIKLYLE